MIKVAIPYEYDDAKMGPFNPLLPNIIFAVIQQVS